MRLETLSTLVILTDVALPSRPIKAIPFKETYSSNQVECPQTRFYHLLDRRSKQHADCGLQYCYGSVDGAGWEQLLWSFKPLLRRDSMVL